MMKNKLIIILSLFGLYSCTDLDEEVYSTIIKDDYYQTEKQVLAAAGPAYSGLRGITNPEALWGTNTFASDEIVLPTRGKDWDNGGIFRRMQTQDWNTSEYIHNNAWNFIFSNVSTCNRLIYQFGLIEDKSDALISITNEIKGLRAFMYFLACDMFGNVPLVTDYDVPEGYAPTNSTRKEVFDFVESELLEVIPSLDSHKNMSTYGRFHYFAAQALLAKLYLNAEVYTGEEHWDDAIAACNAVIDSSKYSIPSDFFSNFAVNNENSEENIFVIPFDNKFTAWGFTHQYWTLHNTSNKTFNMQQGGWNGFCAVPSFYNSYDENDIRRLVWLTGQQYSLNGEELKCVGINAGEPLIFTVSVSALGSALEYEGARLAKYDYTGAENWTLSNDFVVFRYADILLMKAEALMRKNGGTADGEARSLVNQVRSRAFPDDVNGDMLYNGSTRLLTLDDLLAERGWEFAGEGWRRNDQVRFGTFTAGTWTFKTTATPDTRSIFPIPQDQLNSNQNLEQNPGYN